MKYHRCNLFETSNGQCVGFAHVYLELKEGNVDFTDLEFVLADDQELVGVEESGQSGKVKSMVGDGKLQRNNYDGFLKEEISKRGLSESKETGHTDDKYEDNTVVDKNEYIANEESIKVEMKEKDGPPASPSPNFEESLTESPLSSSPSSSSRWEDTNLPQGLPSMEREDGPPISSIFGKYFSETNLSTGSGRKKEIVECKLCQETGKVSRITRQNISAHMRSLHLPEEECEVCGKYVKSLKMPRHQIMCGSTCERSNHDVPHEGICMLDRSAKKPFRKSNNCPYCEKPIPPKNFNRDFERHLRISCPENPVKISLRRSKMLL